MKIGILFAVLLIALVGCTDATQEQDVDAPAEVEVSDEPSDVVESETDVGWRTHSFTDVLTNEQFKLSDYDKPVLVESFAVWCPTCTRQQQETKKLHEQVGDEIVSVAINTDPNENAEKVKQHAEQNGFDFHYAVSPQKVTDSFVDEFGVGFVNAPSVPMILLCPAGDVHELPDGVVTADELKNTVDTNCAA